MSNVIVIGAGETGQAIARPAGVGKHVVLASKADKLYKKPGYNPLK